MTEVTALSSTRPGTWWAPLFAGVRGVSWLSLGLIVAINMGVAAILYTDETRAFWHPLITAQCCGLSIAYAVNAAAPWDKPHPVLRLVGAVVVGSAIGLILVFAIKGYLIGDERYRLETGLINTGQLCWTMIASCIMGTFISLFFMLKFQEARARAQMLKADADRHRLSKQALEAELKLMQAQVEPHFLFNTLASVQFLTETNPPQAGMMLGHLLAYLRAALPQLRSDSTTLGQEIDLAQAYLSIMQMRMGARLAFVIAVPGSFARAPLCPDVAAVAGGERDQARARAACLGRHDSTRGTQ